MLASGLCKTVHEQFLIVELCSYSNPVSWVFILSHLQMQRLKHGECIGKDSFNERWFLILKKKGECIDSQK